MQPVRYFDGTSLEGADLGARFDAGRLVLKDAEGRDHAAYQIADLRLRYRSRLGDRVDLGVVHKPDVRVMIEGPDAEAFLASVLPVLTARQTSEARHAGLRVGLVLAGIVAGALMFVWQLENIVMPFIPESTEQALGRNLVDGMVKDFGGACHTPEGDAALDRLKARLMAGWREGREVHLHVAANAMVNAFTLPGGQIVVLEGLLEKAESPEEVAGVLAHEMGHERHRHPMRGLIRMLGFQAIGMLMTGSNAASVGQVMLAMSYSRQMEEQADEEALALLKAAELSPAPLAHFFDRLAKDESLPDGLKGIVGVFSSHPDPDIRAERMRAGKDAVAGAPALSAEDWQALKAICGAAS